MIIVSATQFHVYLPWGHVCLASCLYSVVNEKEKALVGAFSVIVKSSRTFIWSSSCYLDSAANVKCVTRVLYNFISPLQRKEFNQDRFGSSCQYQTSVFQDNRVSPDVIPDSFTHLNKCQDFTASINDSKQVNIKYTIRSIVCEASSHPILSFSHSVTWSLGHSVTQSVTQSLGHSVNQSLFLYFQRCN